MESVDYEGAWKDGLYKQAWKSNSENEFITEFDAIFKNLSEPLGNVFF